MATGLEIQHKIDFHVVRWIVVLLLLVMAAVFMYFGYRWYMTGEQPPIALPAIASADPGVDESKVSQKMIDSHIVKPYEPRYLSIPKLRVEKTRVMQVGLTREGMLDVPANISDVASSKYQRCGLVYQEHDPWHGHGCCADRWSQRWRSP